ncbi:hypothetical protein FLAV_02553 [Flavobacteriales bacterium]|nr:hypothetical protein FLAV_02553 [Flavobacteriales bacterium]
MDINCKLVYLISVILVGSGCLFGIFKQMKDGFGEFNTKVYGITIIAILISVLALSDIDSSKLSPAYGILGAIAGYLFGLKKQ